MKGSKDEWEENAEPAEGNGGPPMGKDGIS